MYIREKIASESVEKAISKCWRIKLESYLSPVQKSAQKWMEKKKHKKTQLYSKTWSLETTIGKYRGKS